MSLMEYSEGNQSVKKPKQRCSNVYIPPPARKLTSHTHNTSERIVTTRTNNYDETKACNDSSLLFLNDGGRTYSVLRSNKYKQKSKNQYKKYSVEKEGLPKGDVANSMKNNIKLEDSSFHSAIEPTEIASPKEDIKPVIDRDSKLSNNNFTSSCCPKDVEDYIDKLTLSSDGSHCDGAKNDQSEKLESSKIAGRLDTIDNDVLLEFAKSENNRQFVITSRSFAEGSINIETEDSYFHSAKDKPCSNKVALSSLKIEEKNCFVDKSCLSADSCPKSPEAQNLTIEENDWESLYDDKGECLADEKTQTSSRSNEKNAISPVTRQGEKENEKEDIENKESIIEIYGFSQDVKTNDLMTVLSAYTTRGLKLAWVDDTHALAIFPSPTLADEVLGCDLPLVRTRPLSQATAASQEKARHLILPSTLRPKTCSAMARRLVSSALGLRVCITPEARAAENEILRKAREEKRLAAKQRDAAWEGVFDKNEI